MRVGLSFSVYIHVHGLVLLCVLGVFRGGLFLESEDISKCSKARCSTCSSWWVGVLWYGRLLVICPAKVDLEYDKTLHEGNIRREH
jgi:hypothetical protein